MTRTENDIAIVGYAISPLLRRTREHCAQLRLDGDVIPAAWRERLQRDAEGTWRINFGDYLELDALRADLRGAGLQVEELQLRGPDLEDVFTDIMKSA